MTETTALTTNTPNRLTKPMKRTGLTAVSTKVPETEVKPIEKIDVESALLEVHGYFEAKESEIVDSRLGSILPRFLEARAKQSNDRINAKVDSILLEVQEDIENQLDAIVNANKTLVDAESQTLIDELLKF
jgi:hypothetical protein